MADEKERWGERNKAITYLPKVYVYYTQVCRIPTYLPDSPTYNGICNTYRHTFMMQPLLHLIPDLTSYTCWNLPT